MQNINTLVLVAGKSSRIQEISNGLPKPLININGKSCFERNLEWLVSHNIKNVWINKHYKPDLLEKAISSIDSIKIKSFYEHELLGTAGSAKKTYLLSKNTYHLLVIYGDNLYNFDLANFYETHIKKKSLFTMAVYNIKENLNSGIASGRVIEENGRIINFVESGDDNDSTLVNAGVYLVSPMILDMIPERKYFDFAYNLFPLLLNNRYPIDCYKIDGYCLAIDTKESYLRTVKIIKNIENI